MSDMNVFTVVSKDIKKDNSKGSLDTVFCKSTNMNWLLNSKSISNSVEFATMFNIIAISEAYISADIARINASNETIDGMEKKRVLTRNLDLFDKEYKPTYKTYTDLISYITSSKERYFVGLLYFAISKTKIYIYDKFIKSMDTISEMDILNKDDRTQAKTLLITTLGDMNDFKDSTIFKKWDTRISDKTITNIMKLFVNTYKVTKNGIVLKKSTYHNTKRDYDVFATLRQILLNIFTTSYGIYNPETKTNKFETIGI